jgi:hypothetical protein
MGFAQEQDDREDATKQSQRVVSFTETPLEHTHAMCVEIEDRERRIQLRPYGLALTKVIARRHAVNPVWYVDMTPAGHEWLAHPIWELRDAAIATGDFHRQPMSTATRETLVSSGEQIAAVLMLGSDYTHEQYIEAIEAARKRGAGERYANALLELDADAIVTGVEQDAGEEIVRAAERQLRARGVDPRTASYREFADALLEVAS